LSDAGSDQSDPRVATPHACSCSQNSSLQALAAMRNSKSIALSQDAVDGLCNQGLARCTHRMTERLGPCGRELPLFMVKIRRLSGNLTWPDPGAHTPA
jgi:hypothetical protein